MPTFLRRRHRNKRRPRGQGLRGLGKPESRDPQQSSEGRERAGPLPALLGLLLWEEACRLRKWVVRPCCVPARRPSQVTWWFLMRGGPSSLQEYLERCQGHCNGPSDQWAPLAWPSWTCSGRDSVSQSSFPAPCASSYPVKQHPFLAFQRPSVLICVT